MKYLVILLSSIWQLPQAILGGIVALFCKGTITVMGHWLLYETDRFPLNLAGLSLYPFVFVRLWTSNRIVKHEYGHVLQGYIFGPLYLLAIGVPSMLRTVGSRIGWVKNYYAGYPENWADRLGGVK